MSWTPSSRGNGLSGPGSSPERSPLWTNRRWEPAHAEHVEPKVRRLFMSLVRTAGRGTAAAHGIHFSRFLNCAFPFSFALRQAQRSRVCSAAVPEAGGDTAGLLLCPEALGRGGQAWWQEHTFPPGHRCPQHRVRGGCRPARDLLLARSASATAVAAATTLSPAHLPDMVLPGTVVPTNSSCGFLAAAAALTAAASTLDTRLPGHSFAHERLPWGPRCHWCRHRT